MRPSFVLLLAAVALLGATGGVAADGGPPPWPDGDDDATTNTTTEASDTGGVSPGQQLAGAVGAQGASLQGELWNRTLAERLANASTPAERAEVIADEVATLEAYLDDLESARANLTGAWESGDLSEGRFRTSLAEFVIRSRTVERRANQSARATQRLPDSTREIHDLNATAIRNLGERAHDLYQFEGEVASEVVEETLDNETRVLPAVGKSS
jgi:hypothetical protein